MFFGQRGAARRDSGDAGALEGDDVEIAFADDEAVGFGFRQQFARLLQAIEHAAFRIERRLGRVDVFGLGVLRQRATAEADDFAAGIGDFEGDAAAEGVDGALVVFAFARDAGLHDLFDA